MEANNVQHSEKRNAHWCFEGNSACEREDGNRRRWDGISPTQKPPTDPPNYVTSVPLIVASFASWRTERKRRMWWSISKRYSYYILENVYISIHVGLTHKALKRLIHSPNHPPYPSLIVSTRQESLYYAFTKRRRGEGRKSPQHFFFFRFMSQNRRHLAVIFQINWFCHLAVDHASR